MELIKNPNFEFIAKAPYFIVLSTILVGAGIFAAASGQIRPGVEFSGGTQLIVRFSQPPEIDRIRAAVSPHAPGAVIQTYGEAKTHQVLIRVADVGAETGGAGGGSALDAEAQKVLGALAQDYPQNPKVEHSSEIVGAIVGAELRQKAILLTVLGLAFQLIYIAVRFKGGIWGAAAVTAALHDVLVCLAFLTFFRYELTLNVIAALLTLVGYSVNDTIVIFDRVRENLKQKRKDSLRKLLNDSLNQTLTRTIISNGTTFLAVLGLYLFGGEVLAGFSFAMVIGIVVGTYSTLYIAIPIVLWWSNWRGAPDAPVGAKAVA